MENYHERIHGTRRKLRLYILIGYNRGILCVLREKSILSFIEKNSHLNQEGENGGTAPRKSIRNASSPKGNISVSAGKQYILTHLIKDRPQLSPNGLKNGTLLSRLGSMIL